MLSEITWKERILTTLRQEQTAVAGRSGETPVSILAKELSVIDANEGQKVVGVFYSLILLLSGERDIYWREIFFLIRHLPLNVSRSMLQLPLHDKIFGTKVSVSLITKIRLLHGFIAVGGKLSLDELKSLEDIKSHASLAWLGSAVLSGHFAIAKENTIALLHQEKIDLRAFSMGLDSWHEAWDKQEDFSEVMKQFIAAVSNEEEKQILTKWLKRRSMF